MDQRRCQYQIFHLSTIIYRRYNNIDIAQDNSDNWITDREFTKKVLGIYSIISMRTFLIQRIWSL